jgi:urease accessory protein
LTLNFLKDGGETRLRIQRQDPPWKVVRAFGPLVHLHNVSGGIVSGDRLALDISVEPGASAQITTTGATRLYRHRPSAADSEQQIRISVGENGLLEYLPDAVIPFAGSRHMQKTAIFLATRATLFWQEV